VKAVCQNCKVGLLEIFDYDIDRQGIYWFFFYCNECEKLYKFGSEPIGDDDE
jgi:hypothetical protein